MTYLSRGDVPRRVSGYPGEHQNFNSSSWDFGETIRRTNPKMILLGFCKFSDCLGRIQVLFSGTIRDIPEIGDGISPVLLMAELMIYIKS